MTKRWTNEQIEYLKEICDGKFDQEIADLINQRFGTNYTKSAINSQKRKHHIRSTADWKTKYTQEVIDFMIENYQGKDNVELARLVNERFGIDTNADKICMLKGNLIRRYGINLRTGINNGCFKKGNIPSTKGKKWDEYMSKEAQERSRKTCYKKGDMPKSHREVGSRRISIYGYHEIKVAEPNKWEPEHRVIYEKAYGPIPEGHKVIFADGNKDNLELDNLVLVSNSEELILNKRKLLFDNKEITKSGVLIAKIIDKTNKIKKGEK